MPILNVYDLQTGDIILEPGTLKIATGTGVPGLYGHASLVLARLLIIHAPGPGKAVCVEPFEIEAWQRDGEPDMIGARVDEGTVVLRSKTTVDEESVLANVQYEAGHAYADIEKLKQLSGLSPKLRAHLDSPEAKKFLERQVRNKIPLDKDGRSCGEVVARVLFSDRAPDMTPNDFATDGRLDTVKNVIIDEAGWQRKGPIAENQELQQIVADYGQSVAREIWLRMLKAGAQQISEAEQHRLAAELEAELEEALVGNFDVITRVKGLASEILPN